MLLLVRGFGWGVGRVAVLLFLQMRQHVPDILDRLESLSLGTLVMLPWFGRDPLARGRYSFVEGHSRNSTVLAEDDLALFGRRIIYSHSRMGGSVGCSGTGFGERDLSI